MIIMQSNVAYGVVKDPHPDKGRATAKVLEKQGRGEEPSSGA